MPADRAEVGKMRFTPQLVLFPRGAHMQVSFRHKLFKVSEPHFPHLQNGLNNQPHLCPCENSRDMYMSLVHSKCLIVIFPLPVMAQNNRNHCVSLEEK